jgi:hypothetical protein
LWFIVTEGNIVFLGFIFSASQYPSIWASGEPNGSNDTNGRYLLLNSAGLQDVGASFTSYDFVCMLENATYRLHLATGKYYRLDIYAVVNQSMARTSCEADGGRLAIPYGVRKSVVWDYGAIMVQLLSAHRYKIVWIDGMFNNVTRQWTFQDGKINAGVRQMHLGRL